MHFFLYLEILAIIITFGGSKLNDKLEFFSIILIRSGINILQSHLISAKIIS
jgi:hypothetical protein